MALYLTKNNLVSYCMIVVQEQESIWNNYFLSASYFLTQFRSVQES
jgi:hypothetical protein